MRRRDFVGRLAAVPAAAVGLSVFPKPALAFHPLAFSFAMAPLSDDAHRQVVRRLARQLVNNAVFAGNVAREYDVRWSILRPEYAVRVFAEAEATEGNGTYGG